MTEKRKAAATKQETNAEKKRRVEKKNPQKALNSTKDSTGGARDVTRSLLQDEERAFPRGGAGVLTALEKKQIQAQATRDVLFEESGQPARGLEMDDIEAEEDNMEQTSQGATPAKHKKRRNTSLSDIQHELRPRIESFRIKRVQSGCMVLGRVSDIGLDEICLDLPNQCVGYVPVSNMSSFLSEKIQKMVEFEDEVGGDGKISVGRDGENIDEGVELENYFRKGEYLRACVVSTSRESEENEQSKKRIELSIKPEDTNEGIQMSDLQPSVVLQASIESIEDHGAVMSLGLRDSPTKGFLARKDFPDQTNEAQLKEGKVLLCEVVKVMSNGKLVKLSAAANLKSGSSKPAPLREVSNVKCFLPGTSVEVLVSAVSQSGFAGTIVGLLSASADYVHSGIGAKELVKTQKIESGETVKARIIFSGLSPESDIFGISVLDHILQFASAESVLPKNEDEPTVTIGTVLEAAEVVNVDPGSGLVFDVGYPGIPGFAHKSMLSDSWIPSLSHSKGGYEIATQHRARIIGYNSLDGGFTLSLQQSVLEKLFLRLEDVNIGQMVEAKVVKMLFNASGKPGLLISLEPGIRAVVTEIHMSETKLLNPERKFKEGTTVKARVLNVNRQKKQIWCTLKKSLVSSPLPILSNYEDATVGSTYLGAVQKLLPSGAVIQFYGGTHAFLPVSEMSDVFVENPASQFRVGQIINVRVIQSDAETSRMIVSYRNDISADSDPKIVFGSYKVGDTVSGRVADKTLGGVSVEIEGASIKPILRVGHLLDGSQQKCESLLQRLRLGQVLETLVIIEISHEKRFMLVSQKRSLLQAARNDRLIKSLDELQVGQEVSGFVCNVTDDALFVQLGSGLTGMLHKSHLSPKHRAKPAFGFFKNASISATVKHIDAAKGRFSLTQDNSAGSAKKDNIEKIEADIATLNHAVAVNPVDGESASLGDFYLGKKTKGRISSIKDTQLNVQLADNVQGRIDVSEVFSKWDDIKDRKRPLRGFHVKQVLDVRILGIHDARNHRFLPISHRAGKVPVFELSAKRTPEESVSLLEDQAVGSWHVGFVNNIGESCLWVNLSPNIRGRLELMELSEDVSVINDATTHFPVGSALQVRIKNVDIANGRLDLSAKKAQSESPLNFDSISIGTLLTGRVTKVTERSIHVQLASDLAGIVGLTEISDDFSEANPTLFGKNDIVRVCVVDFDKPNKRILLSTRPSKVLSSSIKVNDPSISSASELHMGDVVRGFVKNVSDQGLFVTLSYNLTGFVRVSELSDNYVRDWKSQFEIDNVVRGRIIALEESSNKIQLSLKESVVSENYTPKLSFNDLSVGQIITGKVRKVEDFGAFIVIDNSFNVSGLCHRSEIAEHRVQDVRKLYNEGDTVKAIVLSVDSEKRRVNFGLKASYFDVGSDEESDSASEVAIQVDQEARDNRAEDVEEIDLNNANSNILARNGHPSRDELEPRDSVHSNGDLEMIDAGGFDWTGNVTQQPTIDGEESEKELQVPKKKARKAEIKADRTADIDVFGPQAAHDYERLLMTDPNSSSLWVQYMAYHLQLSDIDGARKVAERALNEINIREQEDKMNVWVAYINLENAYGTDQSLEEVFQRACEYSDAQEIHERSASIFIKSGKHDKARDIFEAMTRKKSFKATPDFWLNYATFIFDSMGEPDRGRELLPRAMKSQIASHTHQDLVVKFAQLEFRSKNGDPERGRTIFEGLVDTYPKQWPLWQIYLDMEQHVNALDNVRSLYERMSGMSMKAKRAKKLFKNWLQFEERNGNQRRVDHVKAKAAEFVEKKQRQKEW